jgi:adenine-specific DNA-methyltransferase
MFDLINQYTALVGEAHRKQFGQYYTESRVAEFMMKWLTEHNPFSVFDPAFGLGAFYTAGTSIGYQGCFYGTEIDAKSINFLNSTSLMSSCVIQQADYLLEWGKRYPAIICNPPYMKFQKFESREQVFHLFETELGLTLSGYTNIASAFLLKSIFELESGGRLAYLMPLEFLNTGYGTCVKRVLLQHGSLKSLIKIHCEKDVFPGVTTSVGILLFEKTDSADPIRFYNVNSIAELDQLHRSIPVYSIPKEKLLPIEKWANYFEIDHKPAFHKQLVPISEYGGFSRGIATGANEFFTLSWKQISDMGLQNNEYIPCITKSAQVKSIIFGEDDLQKLQQNDAPVFLLNLYGSLSESASKYIAEGEKSGFHRRYLTKNRKPWYKIEKRNPSPILLGVFSRDGYKVIRNYSSCLNLTCFHGFQPNIFGAKYVDHLFLYLMSESGRKIISQNMRTYGDSLDKFEPNDLNKALCPSMEWLDQISLDVIEEELQYLKENNKLSSTCDALFANLLNPELTNIAKPNTVVNSSLSHLNQLEESNIKIDIR